MDKAIIEKLKQLNACPPAIEWAQTQPDWETLWQVCERGDWMAWIIHRLGANGEPWSDERKPYVAAMCKCARLVQKYVPKGEKRPMKCIKTHEAWVKGRATIDECRQAKIEAIEAVGAAEAIEVAWAVEAGEAVGMAGAAEAGGAAWAAWAAGAAVWAAGAAEATGVAIGWRCATIIRQYYPHPPDLGLLG